MIARRFRYVVPVVLALSLVGSSLAIAGSQGNGSKASKGKHRGSATFHASLDGHQETPMTIHTAGKGHLTLTMTNSTTFEYRLEFSGLTGTPTAAHIHFGAPGTSGGVIVDLCGGTKPACPTTTSGTVTGTFAAADVKALPAQGFAAGDFAGFVDELRQGFMYANLHTSAFGMGEIRGQIGSHRGRSFDFKWWGRGHDKDDD
jgi:hypothetical protein